MESVEKSRIHIENEFDAVIPHIVLTVDNMDGNGKIESMAHRFTPNQAREAAKHLIAQADILEEKTK